VGEAGCKENKEIDPRGMVSGERPRRWGGQKVAEQGRFTMETIRGRGARGTGGIAIQIEKLMHSTPSHVRPTVADIDGHEKGRKKADVIRNLKASL